MTALEIARKVKSKEITAVEAASAFLDRIKEIEPDIKAWEYIDEDNVLRQAKALDEKIEKGIDIGRLAGVPVGVKDIFNTFDMPTSMGSPLWAGFTPGNDARVVHYLRRDGGIVLGKTVTAEFAVHAEGKTVNPHNFEYSPGTSSSGSAAAVAASMVPLALGTQTAGSTIRPASYCGIYGFKPSFGLLPRTGMLKTTDSLDTVGLFARTPEDLELLFDVVRVHGPNYPYLYEFLDKGKRNRANKGSWKIALVTDSLRVWDKAAPYAQKALKEFALQLKSFSGIELFDADLDDEFNSAYEIHSLIYDKTLAYYFKEEFKEHTLISPIMYEIITRGSKITPAEYVAALERQNGLSKKLDLLFQENGYDALITLSTAGEAPKLGCADILDSCLIWTLCGAPAISVPLFKSPRNLPFGLQIISRRYDDLVLLQLVKDMKKKGLIGDVAA